MDSLTHITFSSCRTVLSSSKVEKQLCWNRKPITPFRLSEILYRFNYLNTEDKAEQRKYKISDPGNFPCESTEWRRWSWCCLLHWSIVSKIDLYLLPWKHSAMIVYIHWNLPFLLSSFFQYFVRTRLIVISFKTSNIEQAIVACGFTIQTLWEIEVLENLLLKLSKRKFMPYSDRLAYGDRTDKEFFKN